MLSIHVLKYFSLNEKSLSSLIQSMVHISYKKTDFQRKHSNHLRSNLEKIAVFNLTACLNILVMFMLASCNHVFTGFRIFSISRIILCKIEK